MSAPGNDPLDIAQRTTAVIRAAHVAIEIVRRDREPLSKIDARRIVQTGRGLTKMMALLEPKGARRVEHIRVRTHNQ